MPRDRTCYASPAVTRSINITSVEDDASQEALIAIISDSFDFPRPWADQFAERVGRDSFRAVHVNGELAGGLSLLPMGQYFGGRAVPMTGISTVAVTPHHRARGAATAIMEHAVRELHEDGCPLSTLYPATQTLYRRSGYEQAGSRWEVRVKLSTIGICDRALTLRPVDGEADLTAVRALHEQRARENAGNLDRRDFNWLRIKSRRDVEASAYLILDREEPQGYCYLGKGKSKRMPFSLEMRDCAITTSAAARRLLTFLADHGTMADAVTWFGSALDPLLHVLPEPSWQARLDTPWMLRIVDVEQALTARGYAPGASGEVHLEVRDDLLPANNDRFVLSVSDGAGEVTRGGSGAITIDVRGLAAVYTGYRTPLEARQLDLAEGDEAALRALGTLFAGPLPWMSDMF